MDKLILVLYVGVGNMNNDDVKSYVKQISESMFPEDFSRQLDATTFVIPTRESETRIECINPKFIIDKDVYRDYRLKLDILNENLNKFILQNKNGE